MKVGLKKLESLGCPKVKSAWSYGYSFDSIPGCDEQTDGHAACL